MSDSSPAVSAFEQRERRVADGRVTVSYLTCVPLEKAGFVNAFSTRLGGVSALPKDALHLAYGKHDAAHVDENRRRFLQAIGHASWPVVTVHQTHSDVVATVGGMSSETDADALVTTVPNLFVGVKTADCLPILIADPGSGVVAAVHAGWRGSLKRIVEKTVAHMTSLFNVDSSRCVAALGPSACGDCFEIGDEVAQAFRTEFSETDEFLTWSQSGQKWRLNGAKLNQRQLQNAGLPASAIHLAPACTMHQNQLYFSHRFEGRENPDNVGRLLSMIARQEGPLHLA